ncbi:bifunctional 4-hydroxy-2-oxoglutarate aldolase/2-dehydro-3-deoxy-phosphogluconate aldolase [Bremerella sp. T1]|uniref:bifunctional 4-hydroxy-2-oxoglutarate aldolase/2-dehydro-3-deoxy-phosphogluconate aldolase n=1 Tax=Bremerella sp. TYQ1 TaxID=3119568 RepID=UPI001CCB6ADF|nr:bifunctional 2-keto-4-hydroxyglutarate aldolase/2-keto-3-deoxy-6-phosphogluconate aldolase [Bremerella volcania]UBM38289.1 bifunctional 2-keto-4-hydroxyglutarate aldolase/2-keto-3-deoxy-6-phosphogluconate aldolase [Bremerella volcania]
MPREATVQKISDTGIVAVIRADNGEVLADVTEALVEGGVTAIEVTFTVPKAHQVLEYVADRFGDKIQLGAGTVLDAETARIAILAGAEFIVSPIVDLPTIEISHRYDKAMMPGALTPTEVVKAWQAGADVVKIFPSDLTGPSYLKALKGPLPQIRMMPTGGVNLDTAESFLKAGACALGVGGSLVEKSAIQNNDMDRIRDLAKQYVEIVQRFRAQ